MFRLLHYTDILIFDDQYNFFFVLLYAKYVLLYAKSVPHANFLETCQCKPGWTIHYSLFFDTELSYKYSK